MTHATPAGRNALRYADDQKQTALDAWLDDVFSYHPPREDQIPKYTRIREGAKQFARVLAEECPECADTSAAMRKLREAVMTANAAIARDGRS